MLQYDGKLSQVVMLQAVAGSHGYIESRLQQQRQFSFVFEVSKSMKYSAFAFHANYVPLRDIDVSNVHMQK